MSGERELDFLGHPIKQIGAMPHAGKVEVIQNIPKPTNIKKVSFWLRSTLPSFYAKSCRNHEITLLRNVR